MKLTQERLKQIIKEEISNVTEAYSNYIPGETAPGNTDMGYGKAPQDDLEPNAPRGITADERDQLESIVLRMSSDELADLMSNLDDETKKVLMKDFLGQSGLNNEFGNPAYDLER